MQSHFLVRGATLKGFVDANESISCDPTYSKGYYRRGSAHVALNQLAEAVKDFKKVCQLEP